MIYGFLNAITMIKLSEVKEKYVYTNKLNNYYNKLVIYKLKFSNNKIYIGQTKNLRRRLYSYININETKGHFVKKAILKYGLSNVELEILKICDSKEDLNNSEIYYISFYDSCNLLKGYNLALGGYSNEPSVQTFIKKIKSSKKVKVGQYDLKGNLIKVFNSVMEASRALNITDSDIHRCCRLKGSRCGYLFSKDILKNIQPYHPKKTNRLKTCYVFNKNLELLSKHISIADAARAYNIPIKFSSTYIKAGSLVENRIYFSKDKDFKPKLHKKKKIIYVYNKFGEFIEYIGGLNSCAIKYKIDYRNLHFKIKNKKLFKDYYFSYSTVFDFNS